MNIRTKIKCFFGFHWWLKPAQEPDTKGLLGYRLPIKEICGFCKKEGKVLYWIEKKYEAAR